MCVCAVNKMCGCFIRAGVCSAGVERENVATDVFSAYQPTSLV